MDYIKFHISLSLQIAAYMENENVWVHIQFYSFSNFTPGKYSRSLIWSFLSIDVATGLPLRSLCNNETSIIYCSVTINPHHVHIQLDQLTMT